MSPLARRRKKRRPLLVPVASMGDIAFLLIIFFMVCSNFAKEARIELQPPDAPGLERLKMSMISVSIDKDGKAYLNGQEMSDAEQLHWGVKALTDAAGDEDSRTVVFKCDRNVDKKDYEPVLDAIARAGGIIAAVGEQESGR